MSATGQSLETEGRSVGAWDCGVEGVGERLLVGMTEVL